MKHLPILSGALLLGGALLAGCSGGSSSSSSGTQLGPLVTVAGGTGRTFVQNNFDGSPSAVGVTIDQAALNSFSSAAPALASTSGRTVRHGTEHTSDVVDEAALYSFALPENSSVVNHVTLDWNPQGHPPLMVYGVPHFDVHFYMVTPAERAQISPVNADSPAPAASYVAPDYVSGVEGVPQMGVHYVDPTSEEWVPQPHLFSKTFIYGYYKGNMTFLEPMLSAAYLKSKPDFSSDIKVPAKVKKTGYYPTKYSIKYNTEANNYSVILSGFVKRNAS